MLQIFAFASILIPSVLRYSDDFHGHRGYWALILGSLWVSLLICKRIHWSAGLVLGWALISSVSVFSNPVSPFTVYGDAAVNELDALSASSYIPVLIAALLALEVSRSQKMINSVLAAFSSLCVIDSVFVIVQWLHGNSSTDRGGFFGNASVNACLIAMTFPILKRKYRQPKTALAAVLGLLSLLLPPMAVLVSRSNMGLAALAAAFMAPYIIRFRRITRRDLRAAVGTLLVLLVCGYFFLGSKFGDNNGRVIVWETAMHWWCFHANHWRGTGLGTYLILGPSVQVYLLNQHSAFFLWMHNDWLQILFEQGFVGFTLACAMVICAFRSAALNHRHWLVAAMAAYLVAGLGDFPMHLPVTGFFGALLIALAFDRPYGLGQQRENPGTIQKGTPL